MRPRFAHKRYVPWAFAVLYVWGLLAIGAAGYQAGQGNPSVRTIHDTRPLITNDVPLAVVLGSFTGTPHQASGTLSEFPGLHCFDYGASDGSWVALVCQR